MTEEKEQKREKPCHVGAPAIFKLELACKELNKAFCGSGCYLVGSSLHTPDWRDVDVRLMMADKDFFDLFPDAHDNGIWEFDSRWLLMTTCISDYLSDHTGLPIDFQFQPQTFANKYHKGSRHALGLEPDRKEPAK